MGSEMCIRDRIVYRTGGFDYIDGFDGYVGSAKNENFVGGNTEKWDGNMS